MPRENVSSRLKKAAATPPADHGQDASLPSKATMEEVHKLFRQYATEISGNVELSQASKAMYIDFASCFVRWMVGGFRPGSHGGRVGAFRKATRSGNPR